MTDTAVRKAILSSLLIPLRSSVSIGAERIIERGREGGERERKRERKRGRRERVRERKRGRRESESVCLRENLKTEKGREFVCV